MAEQVCPWWLGRILASPVRRIRQNPAVIVGPWVEPGMTVLEPGSGMGFFSLPLARIVGPSGRVVCVELQQKMLEGLVRRAERAGLSERVEARLCNASSLEVQDLAGRVDFVLAFAVVHELPNQAAAFGEMALTLRPGGRLLIAEPAGHVRPDSFAASVGLARSAGLRQVAQPEIRGSLAAVMERAA